MSYEYVRIHQTVHGYSSGHKLLSASLSLPPSIQREMVILSDLSGPSAPPAMEPYFTGYPLPAIRRYALAKTWAAPEMPRPGCVWTHTLLIDNGELGRIPNLRQLAGCFKRPNAADATTEFERPLIWAPDTFAAAGGTWGFGDGSLVHIIEALYGWPERPIIVAADAFDVVEHSVFTLWSQQWPRLRQEFSFCTLSLANRTRPSGRFDLQVTPTRLAREVRRSSPDVVIVNPLEDADSSAAPWAQVAAGDLMQSRKGDWRTRLWELAEDLPSGGGRKLFAPLVELTSLVDETGHGGVNVGALIEKLAERFPEPNDGSPLKQLILGTRRIAATAQIDEHELLWEIATSRHGRSLDATALKLRRRAGALWNEPERAAELLGRLISSDQINPHGHTLIKGLADSVDERGIGVLRDGHQYLLLQLIRFNPSLVRIPAIWRVEQHLQREIFQVWLQRNHGELDRGIVPVLLTAHADGVAPELGRFDGAVVESILEWVETLRDESLAELGEGWRKLLSRDANSVFRWLNGHERVSCRTLSLIADTVESKEIPNQELAGMLWLRHAAIAGSCRPLDQASIAAFGLSMAMRNVGHVALAVRFFEPLHSIASRHELPEELWRRLPLPTLPWYETWDWCERLRRGLVLCFIEFEWPALALLDCARDGQLLARLLQSAHEVRRGGRFVRTLLRECREHRQEIPVEIREALSGMEE